MSTINFHQAIEVVEQIKTQQTKDQKEAIQEFLESTCDLFSSSDWFYYEAATGKDLQWLKNNASYNDPTGPDGTMLDNAIIDSDYELAEIFI